MYDPTRLGTPVCLPHLSPRSPDLEVDRMENFRQLVKTVIPSSVLAAARRIRDVWRSRREAGLDREQVFANIYRRAAWGRDPTGFCSGAGSTDETVVGPYVEAVLGEVTARNLRNTTFVDLGCGDFRVGRRLVGACRHYVGVDVVRELIAFNQRNFGSDQVEFRHLDIVSDELPDGDVCFVRQVLQHLDNSSIARVLEKLGKYRLVLITEHQPTDEEFRAANLEKTHGAGIRLDRGSGVYLDQPPFGVGRGRLREVLSVPGAIGSTSGAPSGVIRTFAYEP